MFFKSFRSLILASALAAAPFVASAQTIVEVGDSGDSLATAQIINGTFGKITGTLTNRGTSTSPIGDVDLFRINILDTAAFGVTVNTDLLYYGFPDAIGDDDTMLFLFDTNGKQVQFNDDKSVYSLDPELFVGDLAGFAPGIYYLGFDQFGTHSILAGGILQGFDYSTQVNQFGTYTLTLTGTGGGGGVAIDHPPRGPVPEPATWALMILGFGAAGAALRRRRNPAPIRIG